jgi:hypothetical protein
MIAFFLVRVGYLSWLCAQFHRDIGGWPPYLCDVLFFVNVYWSALPAATRLNGSC